MRSDVLIKAHDSYGGCDLITDDFVAIIRRMLMRHLYDVVANANQITVKRITDDEFCMYDNRFNWLCFLTDDESVYKREFEKFSNEINHSVCRENSTERIIKKRIMSLSYFYRIIYEISQKCFAAKRICLKNTCGWKKAPAGFMKIYGTINLLSNVLRKEPGLNGVKRVNDDLIRLLKRLRCIILRKFVRYQRRHRMRRKMFFSFIKNIFSRCISNLRFKLRSFLNLEIGLLYFEHRQQYSSTVLLSA